MATLLLRLCVYVCVPVPVPVHARICTRSLPVPDDAKYTRAALIQHLFVLYACVCVRACVRVCVCVCVFVAVAAEAAEEHSCVSFASAKPAPL